MSANREQDARAKISWPVRVGMSAVERLTQFEREHGVLVGTWLDWAFESLATGDATELRTRLEARVNAPLVVQLEPWRFAVDAVTVVRAKQIARELSVTQSKLVTLVIDCLTDGGGGDGGGGGTRGKPGGKLQELLRIIYTAAPTPALTAAGGLNPAEASTA